MKNKIKNFGFSLVETVIYLAIVAVLLTAVINFNLVLGNNTVRLSSKIEASNNRRVALATIDYLFKNADGLLQDTLGNCSDFSASPPVLALYFANDDYLPGTCVENGGGVKISLVDRRLVLSCYPNLAGNGYHHNCNQEYYPVGNTYYLTSPEIAILNSGLLFEFAQGPSISSDAVAINAFVSVGSVVAGSDSLKDVSFASSTVVMGTQQPRGPVTFWRFEENSVDSAGDNDGVCGGDAPPNYVDGLIDGSDKALNFNYSDGTSWCKPDDPADPANLNFGTAFTSTAWIKATGLDGADYMIINKYDWSSNKGYFMTFDTGAQLWCGIGDSQARKEIFAHTMVVDEIYFVACIYDHNQDLFKAYVYQKGVGGVATSTAVSPVPILVNYQSAGPYVSYDSAFAGVIDEVRLYNRALSDQELWALQSAGAY